MATKGRLVESAKKLIAEKGYNNTKVEDITNEAQAAKGTFYTYFKTKEDTVLIVPGMVFTIEPMLNQGTRHVHLNYNDDWTVYTDDGKLSAQWEHTLLVTEDGVEIISK